MNLTLVLRTLNDAINAVRSGKYIIGSVSANGDLSFSASPALHDNPQTARAECRRLATMHPGKLFVFTKFTGAEMVPTNTVSI